MTDYKLNNIDPLDIDDLLVEVEKSFGIKFVENELVHIKTFGEFCDHIVNKIELVNSDDCTSQQAFYKLREAISSTLLLDNKIISPNLSLNQILPRKNRRSNVKKLENYLDLKLKVLRASYWVVITLLIMLLASIVVVFFNSSIGILGIALACGGIWLSNRIGNELDLKTVGELAQKMTRENYLKSRRNPNTYNRKEIEKVLTEWFSLNLYLKKNQLTREAEF